jgi:hypothetical protein
MARNPRVSGYRAPGVDALEETAFHFVCVCPALSIARTREFGKSIMNVNINRQLFRKFKGLPPIGSVV